MSTAPSISRRGFLGASATLAMATMTQHAWAQPQPDNIIPAVDSHVHFYDPTRPGGIPWPPPSDTQLYKPMLPADYAKQFAGAHHIVGVVAIEANAGVEDNLWILEIARDNPLILAYVGRLDLGNMWFGPSFRRLAMNPIFRGLRINNDILAQNIDKPEFQSDLKRLADGNYSLDVAAGATIGQTIPRIKNLFPDLRIIIDHLPHRTWNGDPASLENSYKQAAALPNVYAKVSEVLQLRDGKPIEDPAFYRPALETIYKLFGPDRCVYGSNYPVSERLGPYATVYKIAVDFFRSKGADVAEKYLWKNSASAYRWNAPPPLRG